VRSKCACRERPGNRAQLDRGLFLAFAMAFGMLGVNRLLLAIVGTDEVRTAPYVIRLLAFVLILGAIVHKNRRGGAG
jgi:hypothetical protein